MKQGGGSKPWNIQTLSASSKGPRGINQGKGSRYVVFFFPAGSLTVIRIINELAFPR